MVMVNDDSTDSEGGQRHDRFRSERMLGREGGGSGGRMRDRRSRSPTGVNRHRYDRNRDERRSREDRSYRDERNKAEDRKRSSGEKRKRDSSYLQKKSRDSETRKSSEKRVRESERERHHHQSLHNSERRRCDERLSGTMSGEPRRSHEENHRDRVPRVKESTGTSGGHNEYERKKSEENSKVSSDRRTTKDDEEKHGRKLEKQSTGNKISPKADEKNSVGKEIKEADTTHKNENKKQDVKDGLGNDSKDDTCEEFFGPALPPKKERTIGPQLPEYLCVKTVVEGEGDEGKEEKERKKKNEELQVKSKKKEEEGKKREEEKMRKETKGEECGRYGPALPPTARQDMEEGELEAEETIGPHPVPVNTPAQIALERRATAIKKQMENKDYRCDGGAEGKKRREDWMTKLPEDKRGVSALDALQPRKFRTRDAAPTTGDTSSWTDTPADKHRKEIVTQMGGKDEKCEEKECVEDERRLMLLKERDRQMDRLLDHKKSKKRDKSLLEMHQKALKKKKKKEKKSKDDGRREERRPFDRNIDLQANRLDEAQRKAVCKKARLLDTRFSAGESKYL